MFYEIIDNMSQHMSKIEKIAIEEDESKFYKTDLDAVQLQLHWDMFLDISREQNVKL